jgi:hypothetical protein
MTAALKPKDKRFDPARIQAMGEPFTVRIEKKKGNASMPVFQKEGLSRDEVMGIENWILTQWTGGGFYEGRVTDNAGNNMDWVFVYDPSQYPEKVPPEMGQAHANPVVAAAAAAGQTAVMMQPAPAQSSMPPAQQSYQASMPMLAPQPQQVSMPMPMMQPMTVIQPQQAQAQQAQPQGYQTFATPYGVSYPQQAQPQGYQQAYMQPQQVGVMGPSMTALPPLSGGQDDHVRRLETQLRDQLLEKKDIEFKSALTMIQQANAQQIAALQAEIRRMGEAGSTNGSAQVRELEKKLEDQKTAVLEQRILALTEAVTKTQMAPATPAIPPEILSTIEALKTQNFETQRRLEDEKRQRDAERAEERHQREMLALQQQIQQLSTTMQQQATQAPSPMLDAVRNMTDRMMGVMVNPIQMIELMDRKAGAADGVIKTMMDMMQGIAGMYQQAVQVTASGGPSTAGVIVQEAISKIGDGIQAAASAVRDRGVMAEKVKVEQAKAQAAMANALIQQRASVPQMQALPQAQGGLAGAPVPPPQAAPPAPPQAAAPAVKPTNGKAPLDRDHALLGAAYDEVMELRKGVAEDKLSGPGAASAIYQGVAYMRTNGIEIPAFKLLDNEQFADFIEVLLPGLSDTKLGAIVTAFVSLVENDGVEMPDETDQAEQAAAVSESAASASASVEKPAE